MQQKSALKYLILEKKIAAMKDEIDVKDAQLHAVVEQGPSSAARKGNSTAGLVITAQLFWWQPHRCDTYGTAFFVTIVLLSK